MSDALIAVDVEGVTPSFLLEQDDDTTAAALLKASSTTLRDLAAATATVHELRERLWAEQLGADARYDVASDLYELASQVQAFALSVLVGVKP